MEFKHPLERWHKIREFGEMLAKMASFNELQEICTCFSYYYDSDAAEEQCRHPDDPKELDGKSQEICWNCLNYSGQGPPRSET